MYKRDLSSSEIEQLAKVLAKNMGLKLEGELHPANALFNQTIETAFALSPAILENEELTPFETCLDNTALPAEKLDSLSEFLYYELGISLARNMLIAPKLNLIYQVLAEKHKIVHLVNFHRKKIIKQYL